MRAEQRSVGPACGWFGHPVIWIPDKETVGKMRLKTDWADEAIANS